MIVTCANTNCNKEFDKKPNQIAKTKHNFCSRSCSVAYNNKKRPKKQRKPSFCKECGVEVLLRRTLCDECNPNCVDWASITLRDYKSHNCIQSNKFRKLRHLSKSAYKRSKKPQQCCNCGYSKHIEICHIKPVYMYDLDTPVSVVNAIDNLIALCPNCHWELDNGLISLPDTHMNSNT